MSKKLLEGLSWFVRLRGRHHPFAKDPLYRELMRRTIHAHFFASAFGIMIVMAALNVLIAPTMVFLVVPELVETLVIWRLVCASGVLVFLALWQRSKLVAAAFSNLWLTACACLGVYLVNRIVATGDLSLIASTSSALLIHSFLLGIVVVGPTVFAFLACGLLAAVTQLGLANPSGLFDKFLVIEMATILVGITLNRIALAVVAFNADREARRELDLLPRDLLRTSTEFDAARSGDALKPRLHGVVCLASDWRGYQALTRKLVPHEITSLLERYYEICHRLLDVNVGKLRFSSDWIADELLVSFLYDDPAEERAACAAALTFARSLIIEKRKLVFKDGGEVAIDVGIASGTALVGLSGVDGRQKLMTVGPVLGEARRLQSFGKELRAEVGALDRIIASDRVAIEGGVKGRALVVGGLAAVAEESPRAA